MMSYRHKVIQSGSFLECYQYETPIKIGHKRNPHHKTKTKHKNMQPAKDLNTQLFLRDFSVRRTRGKITRLINANPDLKNFLTLTFKENLGDLKAANKLFHNFIKRLKRRYPDLKYLAVPEFQKRGAVHYHVLLNLDFVAFTEMAKIWGHGYIDIHKIRHVKNLGLYISKYIGKDLFDRRYFGMRKVLYSRNLDRPKIIVFSQNIKNYLLQKLERTTRLFTTSYTSDYQGRVDYELYRLC